VLLDGRHQLVVSRLPHRLAAITRDLLASHGSPPS
jgi:hypothetical protein